MLNPLSFLQEGDVFPDPSHASKEGLLAWGGELSVSRLRTAYCSGIFPWFNEGNPVLWWSPDPRCVIFPEQFYFSKSMRRFTRRYSVHFDEAFGAVVRLCASRPSTWITPVMQEAYEALHVKGMAHCVAVREKGELVGGVYGVCVGGIFCAESMVSLRPNASKVALWALFTVFNRSLVLLDAQVPNPHLMRLGAQLMPRNEYLDYVAREKNNPCGVGV
ncbi:MAG: leucyl/phenylalanyl-tRNA--protein transferase [Campylobacterales bacterium]|nr:leucyl/phenylalanyl-tRNA--protein transferase [Campylobacterales bacterium]